MSASATQGGHKKYEKNGRINQSCYRRTY